MFRITIDPAGLRRGRDALARRRGGLDAALHAALHEAADRAAQRLEQATPRSRMEHQHMQDRWTVIPRAGWWAVRNEAPYALYVAAGTRRMRANPALARALADLPDHARRDAAAALDTPTAP